MRITWYGKKPTTKDTDRVAMWTVARLVALQSFGLFLHLRSCFRARPAEISMMAEELRKRAMQRKTANVCHWSPTPCFSDEQLRNC